MVLLRFRLVYIFISCVLQFQSLIHGLKFRKKPIMIAEPLNPDDYENAWALVIDEALGNEPTVDDGTYHDIIESNHKSKLRIKHGPMPWTDATVPYMLDSKFTDDDRAKVAKAVDMIQSSTCVKIVQRTTEANYVLIEKNTADDGCSSSIGMSGGQQHMTVAQRCLDKVGSTAHEFMHALGFNHEHARMNRDNYVIVHWENIIENRKRDYRKADRQIPNEVTEYDLHSITSYTGLGNSKNGLHTMDPRYRSGTLGQRTKLTELDIKKVNLFYNCPANGDNVNARYYKGADEAKFNTTDSATAETRIEKEALNTKRIIGQCKDFDVYLCKLWAKHDYCTKSPIFMPVYCKKTCKRCDTGCVDMNKKCPIWAAKKYCLKFELYMRHYCAASCATIK